MEKPLGRQLAFASKALRSHMDQGLAGMGSSFQTHLILMYVDQHPGAPQSELARRLGVENSTLTHHLDRLAAAGLVERVRGREDRRTYSTVLTDQGRAHLHKTTEQVQTMGKGLRSLFSPAELTTFESCLQRIIDQYGRTDLDDYRSRLG